MVATESSSTETYSPPVECPSESADRKGAEDDPRKSSSSIVVIFRDHYGTSVCRGSDAVRIVLVLAIVIAVVIAISTQEERLVELSEFIRDLEYLGHLIFFAMFVFVGLPFGYNWSTTVVLVGFAYGWIGIIDCHVGTVAAAVFSCYSSRYCMRSCSEHLLKNLNTKKRSYFLAVRKVIESSRGGFLMQIIVRIQPIQTFGLTNAFFGVFLNVPLWKYVLTTLLGMEHSMMMLLSIGILVRDVGSLSQATQSGRGQVSLIVNSSVAAAGVVAVLVLARYLAIHVLPGMIPEDATIDVDPENPSEQKPETQEATPSSHSTGEDVKVPGTLPAAGETEVKQLSPRS